MTRAALIAVVLLAGCGNPDFSADQGPCTHLDEGPCQHDARCQVAYDRCGLCLPAPRCLQLDGSSSATVACAGLDRDGCRARADCSPIFWQDTGPVDEPVGDPYFKSCEAEASQ